MFSIRSWSHGGQVGYRTWNKRFKIIIHFMQIVTNKICIKWIIIPKRLPHARFLQYLHTITTTTYPKYPLPKFRKRWIIYKKTNICAWKYLYKIHPSRGPRITKCLPKEAKDRCKTLNTNSQANEKHLYKNRHPRLFSMETVI